MHPLLHSLTAYLLVPQNTDTVFTAYIADLKPIKRIIHSDLYSRKNGRSFEAISRTASKISSVLTRDELRGIIIHLLGDLWWELNIRTFLNGFSLNTRRCIETTWAMKFLERNYKKEVIDIIVIASKRKPYMFDIIHKLAPNAAPESIEFAEWEFDEIMSHFQNEKIQKRAKNREDVINYHKKMDKVFDLTSVTSFIHDNLEKCTALVKQ